MQRNLGETEASYYLPSREGGVNDIGLHLGFHASSKWITRSRILLIWAILRLRHPLLSAQIDMFDYGHLQFIHEPFGSTKEVLRSAQKSLGFNSQTKDEMINSFQNGERMLSDNRLSYLVLSSQSTSEGAEQPFDLLICAVHSITDGQAIHALAGEFLGLLGGLLTEKELITLLGQEFNCFYDNYTLNRPVLLGPLEDHLPSLPQNKFFKAASGIDFKLSQRRILGGHSFPRRYDQPRHSKVLKVGLSSSQTKIIFQNCKAHGVSVSSALFAICNIAWARGHSGSCELPLRIDSALNLRPYFKAEKEPNGSRFLAVSYFNVVLPAFLPQSSDLGSTFWHRARSAKKQIADTVTNPLLVSRSLEMARVRGLEARIRAKRDDEKPVAVASTTSLSIENTPVPESVAPSSKVPSTALMESTMLGNLDGMYNHGVFPHLKLHTLTPAPRQNSGGMLLVGYTFVGELCVSLVYDENGFDRGVVNRFWANVLSAIDEFLLSIKISRSRM